MSLNIRRRFLLRDGANIRNMPWAKMPGVRYSQGFLSTHADRIVSVRIGSHGASLIVAGQQEGPMLPRFEYDIPMVDAYHMLTQCEGPKIERQRRRFRYGEHFWSVDEYKGDNEGLIIGEVELDFVNDLFEKPEWMGEEITDIKRYELSSLLAYPFKGWDKKWMELCQDVPEHSMRRPSNAAGLRACPHCGKVSSLRLTDTVREQLLDPGVWVYYLVRCDASRDSGGCGAMGGWEESEDAAVAIWNQRADPLAASQHVIDEIMASRSSRRDKDED